MKRFLVSGFADFGIEVETGVANVELHGRNIVGTWLAAPKVIRSGASRPIAVELLNSLRGFDPGRLPDPRRLPEAALKFTKRFGPVSVPYRAGLAFSFTVDGWYLAVHQLRSAWAAVSYSSRKKAPIDIPLDIGECFRFANGGLTFRTHRLDTFVILEIASVLAPRLCVCANNRFDCKCPYFIASDKREKYCSESCARAGKRRANLDWWNKNRKGGEDGTQKAR
jgi:hypothetical protein